MIRSHLRLVAITVFILLLLGTKFVTAQEYNHSESAQSPAQQSPVADEQDAPEGFTDEPGDTRPVGTPVDLEQDLNDSFPQPGSVLKWTMPPATLMKCETH